MAMKFRAHDTFFIRKGWLSKGMRNVVANPDVFVTKDKDRNPRVKSNFNSINVPVIVHFHTGYSHRFLLGV